MEYRYFWRSCQELDELVHLFLGKCLKYFPQPYYHRWWLSVPFVIFGLLLQLLAINNLLSLYFSHKLARWEYFGILFRYYTVKSLSNLFCIKFFSRIPISLNVFLYVLRLVLLIDIDCSSIRNQLKHKNFSIYLLRNQKRKTAVLNVIFLIVFKGIVKFMINFLN